MAPKRFINCRLCVSGKLVSSWLTVSSTGWILPNSSSPENIETIDLHNAIVAPGFIDIQINGALGFHFAHVKPPLEYENGLRTLAHYLPKTGVTGFFPTVPTVTPVVFKHVLPFLLPKNVAGGASVLGAHVEGPFLAPAKKGAHDAEKMFLPLMASLVDVYGKDNLENTIKILTIAPELPGALSHIKTLKKEYGIHVSMGHSSATHLEGIAGTNAGANMLTHTFNAMNPLNHREPGLPGLIATPLPPYFSLIADAIHVHPSVIALAYRSQPVHCILITDSIELSGLPDGIYPPSHAQISHNQVKEGNKVIIEGTKTLVGTCIGLDECIRNLMLWASIPVQEAVMCVTENVATAMGLSDRGKLQVNRRADFVVLSEEGVVKETWVRGEKIFSKIEIDLSGRSNEWLETVTLPDRIIPIDENDSAVL